MINEFVLGISRGLALGIGGIIIFLHVSAGKYFEPVIKYFEPAALFAYLLCLTIWLISENTGESSWTG
jgi:hypothetical protein